jgi:hypothetical protein
VIKAGAGSYPVIFGAAARGARRMSGKTRIGRATGSDLYHRSGEKPSKTRRRQLLADQLMIIKYVF